MKTEAPSPEDAFSQDIEKNANNTSNADDKGSLSTPCIAEFEIDDPTNPQNFSAIRKWFYVLVCTMSVLLITLISSSYTGSAIELTEHFNISSEVLAAGVALYVLGFAVGPCLWAPLSELYGRRILFITTHIAAVGFIAGTATAQNIETVLICRFFTGMFGASPLTNSGGVIADMFSASQRGLPIALFAAAPFVGPTLGPAIGGFISENIGWRWVEGVMGIALAIVGVIGSVFMTETYAPVILARKAKELSKASQNEREYISIVEKQKGPQSPRQVFAVALKRPWVLLFLEPIVLVAAAYLSILYATIYMFLGAFPIVYQEGRGWSEGIGGLAFLGMMIGMLIGVGYLIFDDLRYQKNGPAQAPEARLPSCCIGAILTPIGMFAFAWTTYPSIHWSASIILSSIFGFGMVLVFMAILNYVIDAYVVYAASVLAATAMMRSFLGAAFPLFTTQMYHSLGVHWASSIPAFLTVLCLPFPFVLIKYGPQIRMRCKYAKEAALLLEKLQAGK